MVLDVTMAIELRLNGGGGHEICHHAAAVHLQLFLQSRLLLRIHSALVLRLLIRVLQGGVELRRRAAPSREQELNVPGCLAVVVDQLF